MSIIITQAQIPWIIARIAYPYRAHFKRNDFVRSIIGKFAKGEQLRIVTDHVMTPTFIDDIAQGLMTLIMKEETGIFHLVGSQPITPYNAAENIADVFGFDKELITKTTREEFFKKRAQRPFRLALKNDKITGLGIRMRDFREGLQEIKSQMQIKT